MNKIKSFFGSLSSKSKKAISAAGLAVMALFVTAVPAFADGNIDSTMLGVVDSAFSDVQTDVLAIIGKALPVALAIMGVVLAISLGVRFFKRAAK